MSIHACNESLINNDRRLRSVTRSADGIPFCRGPSASALTLLQVIRDGVNNTGSAGLTPISTAAGCDSPPISRRDKNWDYYAMQSTARCPVFFQIKTQSGITGRKHCFARNTSRDRDCVPLEYKKDAASSGDRNRGKTFYAAYAAFIMLSVCIIITCTRRMIERFRRFNVCSKRTLLSTILSCL